MPGLWDSTPIANSGDIPADGFGVIWSPEAKVGILEKNNPGIPDLSISG